MSNSTAKKKKLIPSLKATIRSKGYSYQTEKVYSSWVLRFIRFHRLKHPKDMGPEEIMNFLSHLANERNVSPSTQNQALNAILFLYKRHLKIDIGELGKYARAKKPELQPIVLSEREVEKIMCELKGVYWLMTALLYGCGLRLKECLRLRVKDIDFERKQVSIRQAKGRKDRTVALPLKTIEPLRNQLIKVREMHQIDRKEGFGSVYLPGGLEKKYPEAPYEFGWQYVFPSRNLSKDPRSGAVRRHHLYDDVLIRHVKKAAISTREQLSSSNL